MICVNKIQIHSRFPVELESKVEHSTCVGGVKIFIPGLKTSAVMTYSTAARKDSHLEENQ